MSDADEEYLARLRKLCERYGHEWESDADVHAVKCADCGCIGDVVNVRRVGK